VGKFVGNITTGRDISPDGLEFADYWDQITPENAGKWGSVQSNPSGSFNWATLDAIYDYTQSHGILFKEHTFIWGSQQPSGTPTQDQVINWFQSFCERYPATALIDVVNEPPPHTTPNYANNIGGGTNGDWQWITNAFIWAREACPNSILIINDFNDIEWSNDNQHMIDIVKTVLANGGPIDAIGAQSHDLDHGAMTLQNVTNLLNKLHDQTGLPIYITEMDLSYSDDQQQLNAYQTYYPLFRDAEFVHGITIWGWIYGRTWSLAPDSGLVRNGSSRPAMTYLMGELGRPAP
jgi:endo-1,4-beta-xylanase